MRTSKDAPPRTRPSRLLLLLALPLLASCESGDPNRADPNRADPEENPRSAASVSLEGADYETEAEKVAHGARVAEVLACSSCHLPDYSGVNFGEIVPVLEGLWATNISLTLPEFSDPELERLLRDGVHPDREMYLMPSKASHFLSPRDLDALIAFLRTIEPTGAPTPPPPPGFEEAVASRLPDDYWRWQEPGAPRTYANSAEEVAYFAANAAPDLGPEHALGRVVALTVCTGCHGAALDGVGEAAGSIEAAAGYSAPEFERLLRDGVDREGQEIQIEWDGDHTPAALTEGEIAAVIAYVQRLAMDGPDGGS